MTELKWVLRNPNNAEKKQNGTLARVKVLMYRNLIRHAADPMEGSPGWSEWSEWKEVETVMREELG